jgi:hypothetical protein
MVRYWICCFCLVFSNPAIGLAATMQAEVHPASQLTQGQLEGTISVYHMPNQVIDITQVLIEDQPLQVERIGESKMTAEELRDYPDFEKEGRVTLLKFELEGRPKGLYVLPAISLLVDGERISSVPSTYDIRPDQALASLRIEAIIDPAGPFYPGQRARFGYRIIYDQPTELVTEILPLLSPQGFEKIGQEEITESSSSLYNIQEIIQEVRAEEPGSYTIPPSKIEGRNFREDTFGQRLPFGPLLRAEVPSITLAIHPFSKESKPPSFTGTVGPISLDVHVLTSTSVLVGDELHLSVRLSHAGDLEALTLPDLACQPGFSGFFQFSDFPPDEHTNNTSKEFIVTLRPMSTLITAIPAIETSYLDPTTGTYRTVRSNAIPITVSAAPPPTRPPVVLPTALPMPPSVKKIPWSRGQQRLLAPEIPKMPLIRTSIDRRLVGILLAIGALLLGFQWWFRERWKNRPVLHKSLTSTDLMIRASSQVDYPGALSEQLEKALIRRLKERGLCASQIHFADQLPDSGSGGRVKAFIRSLQHSLYGGGNVVSTRETLEKAHELYRTLN